MTKAYIAQSIESSPGTGGGEDPVQLRRFPETPPGVIQYFGGAVPPIMAFPVCPVVLIIEIAHPSLMGLHQCFPGGRLGTMPISHAPHHVDVGFTRGLPALVGITALMLYAERLIDGLSLLRPKDRSTIAD